MAYADFSLGFSNAAFLLYLLGEFAAVIWMRRPAVLYRVIENRVYGLLRSSGQRCNLLDISEIR